jgi:hypothetical protein
MTGILGGGGGMSWGLGKTGDVKAHLPSIANGSGAGASPPGGGYSLVSANRSARLAGNSPRDVSRAFCKPTVVKVSFVSVLVAMLTVACSTHAYATAGAVSHVQAVANGP